MKVHGDAIELFYVFDDYSLEKEEPVSFWPGNLVSDENEDLVWLLFVHNQILTADDGDVLLVLALLEANDFVGFPGDTLEQINWKRALEGISMGVIKP